MGAVYVGTDQRFGSTVAIKETFFSDENLTRAFEREARLLNSLRHPALPRVSDHFIDGNGQFLVMEYIPGEDLSEMLAKRVSPFPIPDTMAWADQLLDALDYLHTQEMPVVHRDIKPQNLKLTPRGQVILLDFGLAKGNPTDSGHQTNTKSVFGYSRVYAPLEQIQGTGTDPRSDLYSLSATIYHLMTGVPPEDALTRATAVLNGNPDPLRAPNSIRPEISQAVSDVLVKTMALNANFRPSSAAAMRAILSDAKNNISPVFAEQETIVSVPSPAGAGSAAIFDQKTQVIGGENTAASPAAFGGAASPTRGQTAHSDGGINIPVLPPETIAARQFAAGTGEKKRPRRWLGIGAAAAAALLLVVGCSAAIYMYKPDLFQQQEAPVNDIPADNSQAGDNSRGGSETAPGSSGEGVETHAQTAIKDGETKEPDKNAEAAQTAKGARKEQAPDAENFMGDDEEGDTPDTTGDTAAGDAAADNKRSTAEEREFKKALNRMVQQKMKQANVKNRLEVQRQIDEALDDAPVPGENVYPQRPIPPNRRKIIIKKRP
jgi:hypothetical protein